ncbi:MAG: hypothetical protein R3A44_45085 [Caldilineaceae bacterium]
MNLFLPTNDDDRLVLLRRIATKAQQDAENGLFLLSARSQERLAEFIERFATTLWRVRQKRERQSQYIQEADAAVTVLRNAIYNVWHQLRWQLEWSEINAHGLEYYGLDRQGRQPKIVGRSGWVEIGHKILTGDKLALEQGYPGMEDSAAFRDTYTAAKDILERLAGTKVELSEVQRQLTKSRRESTRVSRRAVAELRLSLSAETEAGRRAVLRSYGVQFITSGTDADATSSDAASEINFGETSRSLPDVVSQSMAEPEPTMPPVSFASPISHSASGMKPAVNGHSVA